MNEFTVTKALFLVRLKEELKTTKDNRDELLEFIKRVDRENWLDGDWWEDIAPLIKKTEALKGGEKTK